ncbi:nuclear transport factor 2 [Fadolivirus algeromassiliense]|jgi:uridine kinase|uniref:Nuclear transport factor 2 n=1 Tax=Fadolivirus FV1/VV64 TaxID=3070911 RepID=A0A7D3USR2_9VIRU|nr:nuclear transport factor 2 [Fadolivirus algeromassiliense]QKF93730.1 nuclear transport factor 2 [Fadolivirus FV1/VV64]
MSFNLIRTPNLIDVRPIYKNIADEFCKYYYTLYDSNFPMLHTVYYSDAQFTYQDVEFTGFNNLLHALINHGIYKFTHHSLNITAQPIGPNDIMILVCGLLSLNDSIYQNKFVETIYLHRDEINNMRVCSTVFKIVD